MVFDPLHLHPKICTSLKKAKKSEAKSEESVDIGSGSTFYQNPANGERSFIMLKPDAVQRGLVGQIVARYLII